MQCACTCEGEACRRRFQALTASGPTSRARTSLFKMRSAPTPSSAARVRTSQSVRQSLGQRSTAMPRHPVQPPLTLTDGSAACNSGVRSDP